MMITIVRYKRTTRLKQLTEKDDNQNQINY